MTAPTGKRQPTILITGCSSGIGQASALRLTQRKWEVYATYRNPDDRKGIEWRNAIPIQLELTSNESILRAASRVAALTHGHLDALFLNAGLAIPGAIEDLSTAAWQEQFEANVFGHVALANALTREGTLSRDGRLIWCSSVLGIRAVPMRGGYCASKAAIEAIADVQRLELGHRGIHVSIIQPGPIQTNFRANSLRNLRAHINLNQSLYTPAYTATVARLAKDGPTSAGTLNPEDVARTLEKVLTASKPAARYRVTRHTHAMALLTRLLPTSYLDGLVRRALGPEIMSRPKGPTML